MTNKTVHHQLRQSRHADFAVSHGSSSELAINPAGPEFGDGQLSPFAVPATREAMNWLVDRDYIANELYGGLAVPRYLPLSTAFPDYARLADVARELELRYGHRPAKAREVITREMEKLQKPGQTLLASTEPPAAPGTRRIPRLPCDRWGRSAGPPS